MKIRTETVYKNGSEYHLVYVMNEKGSVLRGAVITSRGISFHNNLGNDDTVFFRLEEFDSICEKLNELRKTFTTGAITKCN
jgi:hypothetical protein